MKNSLVIKIAILLVSVMFVTALSLVLWYWYTINQVPLTPQVNIAPQEDPFEGLSQQESDRKVLEALTPSVQKTAKEKEQDLKDIGTLLSPGTTTGTNNIAPASFFDLQGNFQTPQKTIDALNALTPQAPETTADSPTQ